MTPRVTSVLFAILVSSLSSPAQKKPWQGGHTPGNAINQTESGAGWAKHVKQGFNVRIWLSNQIAFGLEAWDPLFAPIDYCDPGVGLEYPVRSCIEHMFGGGPMIGGLINGVPRVDESYNGDDAGHEFQPGLKDTARDRIWFTHAGQEGLFPNTGDLNGYNGYYYVHGIQVNRRGIDDDGDGKVDEDELDGLDNDGDWNPLTDDVGADGLPDSLEASCSGKVYNPITNPDPAEDNFDSNGFDSCHTDAMGNPVRKDDKNRYTEKNGIPDHGEPHVDEDYGGVSEKDYYMCATDTFTSSPVPGHVPMGMKCLMKSYAWEGAGGDGILPFDYTFVNIGQNTVRQVYIGFWCDMDVGPANVPAYNQHNYACYMPDTRTAYVDNKIDSGSTPMGLTLLHSPRALDSLKYVFQWTGLYGSGPGEVDSVIYSWMNGSAFIQLIKPCQNPSYPGDIVVFFAFGPFPDIKPGDSLSFSAALVGGLSVDTGAHSLRANAQKAIDLYNANYVLAVREGPSGVPGEFDLFPNYPNPFNPSTIIRYAIPEEGHVTLSVFDVLGRKVATLVDQDQEAGTHAAKFEGGLLSSGVYFCRLEASGRTDRIQSFAQVRKMLLVR